jgi:hypothetical protein
VARRRPSGKALLSGVILAALGFLAAFALVDALVEEGTPASSTAEALPRAGGTAARTVVPAGTTVEEPEPIDPEAERFRAPCPVRDFRLVFDREGGLAVLFAADGRTLATVTVDSHRFENAICPSRRARAKIYQEGERPGTYESGAVACSPTREIDVEVHPTVDPAGRRTGTVLLVSERGRSALLVSAVLVDEPPGRRVYYSGARCELL